MNLDVQTMQNCLYANYMAGVQLRKNLLDQNDVLQSQIHQNMQKICDAENQESNFVALANFRTIMVAQNQALYMQMDYNYYKIDDLQAYLNNNYHLYTKNVEKMNEKKQCRSVNCSSDNGSSDNSSSDHASSDNASSDNGNLENGSFVDGNSVITPKITPLAGSSSKRDNNEKFDTIDLNENLTEINHTHDKRCGQLRATKKRYLQQFKNASQIHAHWRLVKQQAQNAYICAMYHKSMHAFDHARTRTHNRKQMKNKANDFQACHELKHTRACKLYCLHAMKCSMNFQKNFKCKLLNFRNQMRCKELKKCFAQFGIEKKKSMQLKFVAKKLALENGLRKWFKKWRHDTLQNITHETFAMQWYKQQSKSKHLKKIFTCFKKYRNTASINEVLVKMCKSRIKLQTLKFKCFFILLTYVQVHSARKLHTKLHTRLHKSILSWSKLCQKCLRLNNFRHRHRIVVLHLCFHHLKHVMFKTYVRKWTMGAWKHFVQKAISKYNLLLMCVKTQIGKNAMENEIVNELRQICPLCGICGHNSATNKFQFENFRWQFTSFADMKNEQLVDDLLYLHDQIRYDDHDVKFESNKFSNERKTEILRQFESCPNVHQVNFIVGLHWASCFNCNGIFSMTVRASVFNMPKQLSDINDLLTKSWHERKYELYERSQNGENDLIVALSAHICDVGLKPYTPSFVMKNLETKKKTMKTMFPNLTDQAFKRFPSLSCILAKMNEDDIGLHHEYLKYKTTFFRLGFTS